MNDQIAIISSDQGKEIINGLNILAALSKHPASKEALRAVIIASTNSQDEMIYAFECLHAACNWLGEINRTLQQDLGMKPINKENEI